MPQQSTLTPPPKPRPGGSRPTPSPPGVPTAGGLADTLDRLRQVLDRLAESTTAGLGGMGGGQGLGANLNNLGSASLAAALGAARAGFAPIQALAGQIQQTVAATASSFAASMTQTTKSWKTNLAGVWGVGGDFLSGFRNAQAKGIPVGGPGAIWGQRAGLGWQRVASGARAFGTRASRTGARAWRKGRAAIRLVGRSVGKGAAARAALHSATGKGGLGTVGSLGVAMGRVNALVAAYSTLNKSVEQMRAQAEHTVAHNRNLSRFDGGIGSAYHQLDMGDFRRNVNVARSTQGSTIALVRAVDQMRENWQAADIFKADSTNRMSIMAASFSSEFARASSPFYQGAKALVDKVDPNGAVGGGIAAGMGAGIGHILNHPMGWLGMMMNPIGAAWGAVTGNPNNPLVQAQAAAGQAAGAQAAALMSPPEHNNWAGEQLHNLAKAPGPFLPRRTPLR